MKRLPTHPDTVDRLVDQELLRAHAHPLCSALSFHRIPATRMTFRNPTLGTGWLCFADEPLNKAVTLVKDPYATNLAWMISELEAVTATDPEESPFFASIEDVLKAIDTLGQIAEETEEDQEPQQKPAP